METILLINAVAWTVAFLVTVADAITTFQVQAAYPGLFVERNPLLRRLVHGNHQVALYLIIIGLHLGGGLYWHDMLQDLQGTVALMPMVYILVVGVLVKVTLNLLMIARNLMNLGGAE